MKNIYRILISSLIVLGIAGNANAFGDGKKGPRFNPDRMVEKMTRKLDLNEMQAANLKEVVNLMAAHHKDRQGPGPVTPSQLNDLLSGNTFDQGKALQYVEENITRMREHSQQMIPVVAKFTDSLSTQQRAKLNKWLHKKGRHMGHFKHANKGRHHDFDPSQSKKGSNGLKKSDQIDY